MATDPPLRVELHDELRREMRELGRSDPREVTAVRQARTALAALGHDPGHPLTSAVRGPLGRGLRELRPRAGRSRYRVLYARRGQTLAMLALAPEAQQDPRGFARALRTAHTRLASMPKKEGLP